MNKSIDETLELERLSAMIEFAVSSTYIEKSDDAPEPTRYDHCLFDNVGGEEFLILTDAEADERCKTRVLESAWAFNLNFLHAHIRRKVRLDGKAGEAFEKMCGELCESANGLVLALIEDRDRFVDDAISADGRGHFLAGYDGSVRQFEWHFPSRFNAATFRRKTRGRGAVRRLSFSLSPWS